MLTESAKSTLAIIAAAGESGHPRYVRVGTGFRHNQTKGHNDHSADSLIQKGLVRYEGGVEYLTEEGKRVQNNIVRCDKIKAAATAAQKWEALKG